MGFVPVNLSVLYCVVWKTHCCGSFHLSPIPPAVQFVQESEFTNGSSGGDGFDFRYCAEYLEILHPGPFWAISVRR